MAIADIEGQQPDISYKPDYDKYVERTKRRLATETLSKTLPEGFPSKLESDLVWDKTDIASRFNWTYTLTPSDIQELETALQHFQSLGKPLGYINQKTFPLPTLHPTLRAISHEIHSGFGFKVIRGLPVESHTREENLILYAGLSSHVASIRGRQDSQFNGQPADVVLNHITDLSDTQEGSKIGTPAYTTDEQVFHTDSGDVIALLCLGEAAEGGRSKVSSSWRVYNEIAGKRPDLIGTLAEGWATEIFDTPTPTYTTRPLLHFTPPSPTTPPRMIIQYARRTFTGFSALPRSPSIPPISEAQAEALDALHFTAAQHALTLDFRRGDVQFVNNLSVFHAREGYRDDVSQGKKRHLVRLWLRDGENGWEIPGCLGKRWERVFKGMREEGGEGQVWPLEGYVRSAGRGGGGGK